MRILLIQPYSSSELMDRVYLFEPLALEYLGAGARQDGHDVPFSRSPDPIARTAKKPSIRLGTSPAR